MKGKFLLLFTAICFFSCDNPLKKDGDKHKSEVEIVEGFVKINSSEYLSRQLLIGKKENLAGISSLNIKGDRHYSFDGKANITSSYDMTNNYAVYSYDEKDRLIKFEIKQHNPPETYHEVVYTYSSSDSVIEIKKSYLENGVMQITEIKDEGISLDHMGVKELYFQDKDLNQLYLDKENREIITYKNDLIFCCGVLMKGKNKLSYYLNENGRIDSLVIRSLEEEDQMKFEYEYN